MNEPRNFYIRSHIRPFRFRFRQIGQISSILQNFSISCNISQNWKSYMCTEDIGTSGKEAECVIDFEKVYSEYYDTVYRYILSLCKDEAWAEEITQEAFFKALKKIDSFRGECKLSVWLCQIAKNTFYTQVKKTQHRMRRVRARFNTDLRYRAAGSHA